MFLVTVFQLNFFGLPIVFHTYINILCSLYVVVFAAAATQYGEMSAQKMQQRDKLHVGLSKAHYSLKKTKEKDSPQNNVSSHNSFTFYRYIHICIPSYTHTATQTTTIAAKRFLCILLCFCI